MNNDTGETEISGRRFGALAIVALLVFGSLVARLWFLQVVTPEAAVETATSNREREIWVEAPRGRILDSEGRVLAGRRESLVVTLDWTELAELSSEERAEIFGEVAEELNRAGLKTKQDELDRTYSRARNGDLKPVVVAEDVGEDVWILIQERAYPGFQVERRFVRTYPYGDIGAHIIGYTGSVRSTDVAASLNEASDKIYLPGDEVGLTGIEKVFEETLRGTPEHRVVEIDANNRIIRTAEILQPAVPGQDIYLTINIDLQYAAEQILADELRLARQRDACVGCLPHVAEAGSLVALDVNDGSVIALASLPTYDPTDFIFGISSEQFEFLENRPDKPLFDRATRGGYSIGSTFKPITAYAALETGLRTEWEVWDDAGFYEIDECTAGCRFQNAGGAVMGPVDLRESLERSSDTYFYAIGAEAWENRNFLGETPIQDVAGNFGLGQATGIQLSNESAGRVPTPENMRETFDVGWFAGNNVNLSIGQGDLLVSPLQLANMYAMIGTGGARYQPRIVDRAVDPETGETTLEIKVIQSETEPLDPAIMSPIRDGLFRVPTTGTGAESFAGFPLDTYPIAGKTGTVQKNGQADSAVFAAFGPGLNPDYAVAAVLEEAGFGGDAAAPAVRRFFELLAGIVEVRPAPLADEARFQFDRPLIPEGVVAPIEDSEPEPAAQNAPSTTTALGTEAAPSTTAPPAADPATTAPAEAESTSSTPAPTSPPTTPATSSLPTSSSTTAPPTSAADPTVAVEPENADDDGSAAVADTTGGP